MANNGLTQVSKLEKEVAVLKGEIVKLNWNILILKMSGGKGGGLKQSAFAKDSGLS